MGEQVQKVEEDPKKQEAPTAPAEEEKKDEAAPPPDGEDKKEEPPSNEPPLSPLPVILGINLHCTGCVNKIKRCVLRCKGVEGVEVDMAQNQVTVKGIVDPQGICDRLRRRTMRNATVISSPHPPPQAKGDAAGKEDPPPTPPVVHSQVSEVKTVDLLVNMHCEACAQQLKKKILKMRGVQTAYANSGAGKLTVTGTMSSDKLVKYIHRSTGKMATVVPPPPPPEPPKEEEQPKAEEGEKKLEEPAAEGEKKPEEPAAEDTPAKKEGEGDKKEEETAKPDEASEKNEGQGGGNDEPKPEVVAVDGFPPEEMMKRMMYWSYSPKHFYNPQAEEEAMMAKRMAMVHPYAMPMIPQYYTPPPPPPPPPPPALPAPPVMCQPYYNYGVMERPAPAPQYFSDEDPNACIIS